MKTPVFDFLNQYREADFARFHMPGHKGMPVLGCEPWDLTEVQGADALYEADGIIAESEQNATALFGSRRTVYSTEGSSQSIRAMLYLALTCRPAGSDPLIVAARNVHKAFIYGAALLDLRVRWLWPEENQRSLCGCPITPENLERTLKDLPRPPAGVYVTSPDYLGGVVDIKALAGVCHRYGTILLVDNAHGAYLRFLEPSRHPLDLGADLCCDSAHKTLPVLTGGGYLHVGKQAPAGMEDRMKSAMALFGSTSPSYLIMASLDRCNRYLENVYPQALARACGKIRAARKLLRQNGWDVQKTDPLRLTIWAPADSTGTALAQLLRQNRIECEYADPEALVLMLTPQNREEDLDRLCTALGKNSSGSGGSLLPLARGKKVISIRQALFAPQETIPAKESLGRICGAPTVSCPPAIPVAVSGEEIGPEALTLFQHYGIKTVSVLKSEENR